MEPIHNSVLFFLTALLLLNAGCTKKPANAVHHQRPEFFEREPITPAHIPSNTIRICTYNIQHFTDGWFDGWRRRPSHARRQAQGAAAIIDQINPDLLIIQEIENRRALKLLNENLTRPYPQGFITRFHADYRRGRKQNIALLSRLPLADVTELEFGHLTASNAPPRGMLRVILPLSPERSLLIYGVHLKSNWGESTNNIVRRQAALQFMLQDAAAIAEDTPRTQWEILVAGDMNVDPQTETFAQDTSLAALASWHDLWQNIPLPDRTTIPTRYGDPEREYPPAAFDRIIVSPTLRRAPWLTTTAHVLQQGIDTNNINAHTGYTADHVSDHYPVYTDIIRTAE
jgi:endonuclease/exonuclease/phosphatase family metal-dependent hydrolase